MSAETSISSNQLQATLLSHDTDFDTLPSITRQEP